MKQGVSRTVTELVLVLVLVIILSSFGGDIYASGKEVVSAVGEKIGVLPKTQVLPTALCERSDEAVLREGYVSIWCAQAKDDRLLMRPVTGEQAQQAGSGVMDVKGFKPINNLPLTLHFDMSVSLSKTGSVPPEIRMRYCDHTTTSRVLTHSYTSQTFVTCVFREIPWCTVNAELKQRFEGKTLFESKQIPDYYESNVDPSMLLHPDALAEGASTLWLRLERYVGAGDTIPNKNNQWFDTDGNEITHYKFAKIDGKVRIAFADLSYEHASKWFDFDEWNNYGDTLLSSTSKCLIEDGGTKLVINDLPGPGWYQLEIQPTGQVFTTDGKQVIVNPGTALLRFRYVP